jgi:MoxR-like ATPase
MNLTQLTEEEYKQIYRIVDSLRAEIGKAVTGKAREIDLLLCAMLAGGHVLIEDVPGVGKTTLAAALAKATGLSFRRAQFTPDVMASDITGFNIYNRKTESFEFRRGLVDTNILLADEINRASPKTQSSLLEAMEESKVTVDGVTYEIPRPFMVIATQNPMGFVGTYPLPEAQMDRFALRIRMGYPSSEDEMAILRARRSGDPMDTVRALPDGQAVALLAAVTEEVRVAPAIEEYIVRLVSATREREELSLGASPRASLSLMKLGRAKALLSHRHYVIPEDIVDLFPETVAPRVTLTRQAMASGTTAEAILRDILAATPVPFLSRANV